MANFDDLYQRMEDSANRATDAAANFNSVLTEDDETDVIVDGRPVPSMSKRIKLRLDEGMVAVDEAVAEAKAEADRAKTEADRAETIAGSVGDVVIEAKAEADRAETEADRAASAAVDAAVVVSGGVSFHGTFEFHNDDQALPPYVVVGRHGEVIKDLLSESPGPDPETDVPLYEFHNGGPLPDKFLNVLIGAEEQVLFGWDESGKISISGLSESPGPDPETDVPLLPYLENGQIRAVGVEDLWCVDVGDLQVKGVFPGSGKFVRAIVSLPGESTSRAVATSPGSGVLVPYADRVLRVIIGVGQSLMVGANSENSLVSITPVFPDDVLMFESSEYSDVRMGAVTPSGQPAEPLDPNTLIGFTPLIGRPARSGPRGETQLETLANTLATKTKAMGVPFPTLSFVAAVGGTAYSGLKKGNQIYENMLIALRKAQDLAREKGLSVVVDAVVCKHGEAGISDPEYINYLREWRADISEDVRVITGQPNEVHFIMSQMSSFTVANPEAAFAMLALHNSDPRFHLAAPDYSVGPADYHTDILHMRGPGYAQLGAYYAEAWAESLWSTSGQNKILQVKSASREGRLVRVVFDVPTLPLVTDLSLFPDTENLGIRFFDSTGQVEVESLDVLGEAGEIRLHLAAEPSGEGERVDVGLTPQTNPRTRGAIPRTNLRDSSPRKSIHENRPLYNWAVHQRFFL